MFGLPLTYAYATLRQSVAGNSTFRGIVFCTPKTVISNFVTSRQIKTPYLSPYGYPNNVPSGQKIMVEDTKKVLFKNVLIPWYPISYLTIARSVFFFGRLRVPTRRCDLVVPADGGWGRSNKIRGGSTTSPVTTEKILHGDFLETSWILPGGVRRFS
jgi:hypothetical protein